jgi:hypothetical protein
MAVRGVAHDESDALLRCVGRGENAEQHQPCERNELRNPQLPLPQRHGEAAVNVMAV